jgi:DNA primase
VERRIPAHATTTWWRKDRPPDKFFVDYIQNARDHTIASATPSAASPAQPCRRRSPGTRIDDVSPQELTIAAVPARFARLGDLHGAIDDAPFSLDRLLEWAARDERDGPGAGA